MARPGRIRADQGPRAAVRQGHGQSRRRRFSAGQRAARGQRPLCRGQEDRRKRAAVGAAGRRVSRAAVRCGEGGRMKWITREGLASYLDDALSERQTADVEQQLRLSDTLRQQLRLLAQERDRGEHSVGAIWRRHRLSCASREQLGSFLLGVLAEDEQGYIELQLKTIGS